MMSAKRALSIAMLYRTKMRNSFWTGNSERMKDKSSSSSFLDKVHDMTHMTQAGSGTQLQTSLQPVSYFDDFDIL